MDLSDALRRIDAIHAHVARGEPYRGYRPTALAASGVVGLLAPLLQPDDRSAFVGFWAAIALIAGLLAAAPTLTDYLLRESPVERRRTRLVGRQFAPCLLAGVVLTLALSHRDGLALLPGAWALLFGLGTVASLPYLPRGAGLVAGWYLLIGAALLTLAEPSGWAVGVPFGVGQLMAAGVLYRDQREGA